MAEASEPTIDHTCEDACDNGYVEVAVALLEKGADVHAKD